MVINLYTEEIVKDFRSISHHEVAEIADVEARYRAEAGSEKLPLIYRAISEGVTRLIRRCSRFAKATYTTEADNAKTLPPTIVIDLAISERRAVGKAEAMAETMSSFILHYGLSQFYSDVSQPDLSNRHSLLAVEVGEELDNMLYRKQPPIL